jgi:hypothetical protein
VQRRALLATLGTITTAGCGWSQYTESDSGPPGGDGAPNGESDDSNTESDEQESLPSSDPVDGPIEAAAEDLLLTLDDLESDDWEETDMQVTGTCNTFGREGPEFSFSLVACAEVHDDAETATAEYDAALDRSLKVLTEQLDLSPEIGEAAAVFLEGERDNRLGEIRIRVLVRDSNATGRIDFTQNAGMGEEDVPDVEVADVVGWAARMHGRWGS